MIDGARLALDLPGGFCMAHVPIGRADDRHACGREAARAALVSLGIDPSRLAYDGTRPIVLPADASVRDRRVDGGVHVHVAVAVKVHVHDHDHDHDHGHGHGHGHGHDHVAISITHGRHAALAVAARVARLGIDLCDDDRRLPALAERFLVDEQMIARTPLDLAACFAAKEAALKALGLGILDGGILDGTAVRVVSLAPPRLSDDSLHLAFARVGGAALAVVYG